MAVIKSCGTGQAGRPKAGTCCCLGKAPVIFDFCRKTVSRTFFSNVLNSYNFTYIDVTAVNKEAGCIADAKVFTPGEAPSRARKVVCPGDVLYSCVRPYLLNIAIVENQWIVLRSPFLVACVEEKMRGQAYPAINDADFAVLPFPLPPSPNGTASSPRSMN
ncbi:MAG: hypothetical protein RBT64_09150 [Trichloromonas sp.]|nr:hypothetical protein [Trichloromonas sp.]